MGAVLLVAQFALGLNWMAVAPLFPVAMAELGVDRATVSSLFVVTPICQALLAIPGGAVSARLGTGRTLLIGLLLMSCGLAMPALHDLGPMVGARVVFGLGTGFTGPMMNALTGLWFRGRELPLVSSLGFVLGSTGVTTALLVTVPLGEVIGWRQALSAFAAVPAVCGVLWLAVSSRLPAAALNAGGGSGGESVLAVLRRPATRWLALAFAAPICAYDVFAAWLPTYYNEVWRIDLAEAAALAGLLGIIGIPASLAGGALSAWVGLRRPFLIVPGALMGVLGMATVLVDQPWCYLPALVLYGVVAWVWLPVVFTVPLELPGFTPTMMAVATGAMLTAAGVTAFVSPLLVGFLTDRTGSYLPGFALFSVVSLGLLLAGLKLPETGPGWRSGRR